MSGPKFLQSAVKDSLGQLLLHTGPCYMHSGYPVMLLLESVQEIADLQFMQTSPIWGPLHELGHNQQRPLWKFPPHTTEATSNLWSVYVHEKVLDLPRSKAHPELTAESRKERIKSYLKGESRLDDWTVWACLETYLRLQESFGWEPFINLDNKAKMNLWAEKFSFQVKRNLVPFFKVWGWPIEEDVCKKLANLPEWMGASLINDNPVCELLVVDF
uniref:Peptidase M60 domain-containing protein n=1 Tax=Erpetoichthys calabaricus TaxID=27687 RepID=A0A8C4T8H7_ERPCA